MCIEVTTAKEEKDDREVDDRKGKETEYHYAEELDLGGDFDRATDTGMFKRGEPESGKDTTAHDIATRLGGYEGRK